MDETPLRRARLRAGIDVKDVVRAIEDTLPAPYHVSTASLYRWETTPTWRIDPIIGVFLARLYDVELAELDPRLPEELDQVRALVKIAGVRLDDLLAA